MLSLPSDEPQVITTMMTAGIDTMPPSVNTLQSGARLILTTRGGGGYYYVQFTAEETEGDRGEVLAQGHTARKRLRLDCRPGALSTVPPSPCLVH